MTVRELQDFLFKVQCEGFGDSPVELCEATENPLFDGVDIVGTVKVEKTGENARIILQYQ